ncbi:MAG: transposase [Planctomycetota bacterium]|nr:MAG: transposase [Planctomycetota bacterium]
MVVRRAVAEVLARRRSQGRQEQVAKLLGVSSRTLRGWRVQAARGRLGRPRREADLQQVVEIEAEWERQGKTSGAMSVQKGLNGMVSLRQAREIVAERKRAERRERRQRLESQRVHVEVAAPQVLWSVDGTQLGRVEGEVLEGQVVRDVCSKKVVGLSVGPPAGGEDVVALLEEARQEALALPLVLSSDHGGAYRSRVLAEYLKRGQVVHLWTEGHVPQQNAWAERCVRELKEESGLDGSLELGEVTAAWTQLRAAAERLNRARLRRSLGWRTAAVACQAPSPAYDEVVRARFYAAACTAVRQAVAGVQGVRARRRAARWAILNTLQNFEYINITRGGQPIPHVKAEAIS